MVDRCLLQSYTFTLSSWGKGTCCNRLRLLEWMESICVLCAVFPPWVDWFYICLHFHETRAFIHPQKRRSPDVCRFLQPDLNFLHKSLISLKIYIYDDLFYLFQDFLRPFLSMSALIRCPSDRLWLGRTDGWGGEDCSDGISFQDRGSAFCSLHRSNDDDDEFWDVPGLYLTERKRRQDIEQKPGKAQDLVSNYWVWQRSFFKNSVFHVFKNNSQIVMPSSFG